MLEAGAFGGGAAWQRISLEWCPSEDDRHRDVRVGLIRR